METKIDFLWVLAFASKCKSLTFHNTFFLLLFLFLVCLAMAVSFWAHPGGHAWGKYYTTRPVNPIPGPRGYPILGSMNLMTGLAHHKLASAARTLNSTRLMAFSLAETRVIITSNPDVAKEILNSSVFADRPIKESAYGLMFNRAIGFAPYGVYWRTLRRIAATHMFSPKQISNTERQRTVLASQMVSILKCKSMDPVRLVRVREILKEASLNNMMCSVFGREYELGSIESEVEELSELVREGYELLGKLNWSDHLPWLAGLDLQKIRFRCFNLVPRVNRFVRRILNEHRAHADDPKKCHDFVNVLLSLRNPDKLSDDDMIAVLWEMIFRGTDTVAVLIEWILARMVLHPEIQSKVHDELDRVVGRSRPLIESDIKLMAYFQSVVKEVLRLHPPGPLLSWARLAITDSVVDGHHVPAGTTAMVNMWAITRDPQVWNDPLKFNPDRFADVDFSVLGSDLRLAPFGSGRRTCPGKNLGLTTVSFWTATLLHEFELKDSQSTSTIDLTEVLKLSCEMANPLTVRLIPRRS
ncbi:cytochrome P450 78A9-like isoform X2 [Rutidosis leptorrhynchoides]